MTVKISLRDRGPLVVQAEHPIELCDLKGQTTTVPAGQKLLLCRCGASSTKPRCDGSHNRIGFEAPPPSAADEEMDET